MSSHLVLAGGGHAHLTLLARSGDFVRDGHRVTVIGPSRYHYYSGMGPGMLGGLYAPEDIRFDTRRTLESAGGEFVRGKIERIDPDQKIIHLASGETLTYDLLSVNVGSYVPDTLVSGDRQDIFTVKPIERLLAARHRIEELLAEAKRRPVTIAVIGGGPAAAEIAGNVWHLANDGGFTMPAIEIFSGDGLLTRFSGPVRRKVRRILTDRGIRVHEAGFVKGVETGRVVLESGAEKTADVILLAPGVRPSPVFGDSGLPVGPDGGLRVNAYLQCQAYPDIFGGGDCIYFEPEPLGKVGVYAVRQNPVLYENVKAALAGNGLRPFRPGGGYMLILNLGGRTGVVKKGRTTWSGRSAFWLKDAIDRRFVARFR